MEDKKLYTFICNYDETEICIVIASSLDDACEIFKRNHQNDKVTQFIHRYGDFHYDEEETDLNEIKEREEHYLALWDVSHYECTMSGEKDDIKYYEYEPEDGWDWFRLTIIEQPLKEYHMIVTCDEDNDPRNICDVLQEIESYENKLKTADIEKVVELIEEGVRDNDKIIEILSRKNKDIIHPQYDVIEIFEGYMTLPVYEKFDLFNLLKGLRIKYPDIKFEAECGFMIKITFENEFEGFIRLFDKSIDFDSDFSHGIEIDITSNNDFNTILDSLIPEIDKAIQAYLSYMEDTEEEENK